MTITNPLAAVSDTGPWVHSTFMVSLGDVFSSYVEGLKYANADQLYSNGGSDIDPVTPAAVEDILNDIGPETPSGMTKMTPLYYNKRKIRDTSLGGNPVINPLPQYNETDDPPTAFTGSKEYGSTGMGRVYSSQIDDQQQILYLQMGTPIFNTLAAYYTGAVDEDTAVLNDKGITYATAYKIGSMIGIATNLVTIPAMSLEALWRYASYQDPPITSYYDFKNEQLLYYEYVNTILLILAANMGFMESSTAFLSGKAEERDNSDAANENARLQTRHVSDLINKAEGVKNDYPGSPEYLTKLNMDIGQILHRRMVFLYGSNATKRKSTDDHIKDLQASVGTTDKDALSQVEDNSGSATEGASVGLRTWARHLVDGVALGSDMGNYLMAQYIGFRIESGVSTSETIHNEIGQSEVASTLNSKQQSIRQKIFGTMGGPIRNIPVIGGALSGAVDAVSGAIGGFLSGTGIEGLAQLVTGSAMLCVPHMWKDSTFRRSYTFSIHLKSEAGDDLSIMQNIYVPFACILAAGTPRAQGPASYTSPFLVKAYARGLVSIPMGMITDLSITRGATQHGWSSNMKPTEMKIDMTIDDLTPEMFISVGMGSNQRTRDKLLGTNNNYINYLEMLAGLDIHSKVSWQAIQRRIKVWWNIGNGATGNPTLQGMRWGDNPLMRVMNNIVPSSWGRPSGVK